MMSEIMSGTPQAVSDGAELLASDIRILKSSMECGNIPAVRYILGSEWCQARLQEHGSKADHADVAMASNWFASAIAYEKQHGRYSLLNRDDPFIKHILIPTIRRHEARQDAKSKLQSAV